MDMDVHTRIGERDNFYNNPLGVHILRQMHMWEQHNATGATYVFRDEDGTVQECNLQEARARCQEYVKKRLGPMAQLMDQEFIDDFVNQMMRTVDPTNPRSKLTDVFVKTLAGNTLALTPI